LHINIRYRIAGIGDQVVQMQTALRNYLDTLTNYAGEARVQGIASQSGPVALTQIFIEPRLESQTYGVNPTARPNDVGPEQRASRERPSRVDDRDERLPAGAPEPALAALSREPRVAVLGEPGMGKSTLIRRYALQLAQNDSPSLPLLIELGAKRDWQPGSAVSFGWLLQRMPEVLCAALGESGWLACCDVLNAGRATVLLDGLDELSDEARVQITRLMSSLRNNRVVITSRPHSFRLSPLGGFKVYTLCPLQPREAELLATEVFSALSADPATMLTNAAAALDEISKLLQGPAGGMARNPLLLSFLCIVAGSRGNQADLPDRPVPLIRSCVQQLIDWNRTKLSHWPATLNAGAVSRILGPLALSTFTEGSGVVRAEKVDRLAEADQQRFYDCLLPARFVAQQRDGYAFPLETFREYFAAQAVAESFNPFGMLAPHLHRPEWERVILYSAGTLERGEAPQVDLRFPVLTWIFVKGIGPVTRIAASLIGKEAAKKTVQEIESHISLEGWLRRSRHRAEFLISSIWKHHCNNGFPHYEHLVHRDFHLAARCAGAAGQSCPARLATQLADLLYRSPRFPSEDLSIALAEAGRHSTIHRRWLEEAKRDLSSPRRFSRAEDIPQWWEALAEDNPGQSWLIDLTRDPKWRMAAIRLLARAATQQQVQARLVEIAQAQLPDLSVNDPNFQAELSVRQAAIKALRSAATVPNVRNVLIELTAEKNAYGLRSEALQALAVAAGESEVREALLRLTGDQSAGWGLRQLAIKALVNFVAKPDIRDALLKISEDEDVHVRIAAAEALSAAAFEDSVQARLLDMVRDENHFVAIAAMRAVSAVALQPYVRARLLELAQSPNLMGMQAVYALKPAADQPSVQRQLLDLMRPTASYLPEHNTCMAVLEVLRGSATEQPEVQEELVSFTRLNNRILAMKAIDILAGAVGAPLVRQRLLELTREEDAMCRPAAISALSGAIRDETVKHRLLELTYDHDPDIRLLAVGAISHAADDSEVRKRLARLTRRSILALCAPEWYRRGHSRETDLGLTALRPLVSLADPIAIWIAAQRLPAIVLYGLLRPRGAWTHAPQNYP
jgi:hypothetical protein